MLSFTYTFNVLVDHRDPPQPWPFYYRVMCRKTRYFFLFSVLKISRRGGGKGCRKCLKCDYVVHGWSFCWDLDRPRSYHIQTYQSIAVILYSMYRSRKFNEVFVIVLSLSPFRGKFFKDFWRFVKNIHFCWQKSWYFFRSSSKCLKNS